MTGRQWWFLLGFLGLLAPLPVAAQDVDPPVISFLEGGSPLVTGQRFGRAAVPVVAVTDASAVTVELTLDGSPHTAGSTISAEGTHELAVTATDAAANVTVAAVSFVVDLTPPEIAAIAPADGAVVSAPSVVLTGSAVDAVLVTIDGAAVTLAGGVFLSDPLPLSAEGARSFTVVATDATGLTRQVTHRVVRDTVPPTVAISQPLAAQLLAGTPIEVLGTVSDLHLLSVSVNGVSAVVSGSTWVARNVPLAEGPNNLVATARDRAGNEATANRTVTLDTRAPEIQVTDPAPGTVTPAATITVSGQLIEPHADRVTVAGVRATLANGAFFAAVPLAEGVNDLVVEAVDRANHQANSLVRVTRDSQAPAIRVTAPLDGAYLAATTTPVAGTVEEEPGLTVTLNGNAVTRTPGAWSAAEVALIEGENPLTARVTDALGNQGAHTRLVFRDSVAPELVAADPPTGATSLDPGSRFRLTFSEEIGGEEELGGEEGGAVVLELTGGGLLPADWVVTGTELTVVPRSPLPSEAALTLRVTVGVLDRAGNPLATPQTLNYTVADVEAPAAPLLTQLPPSMLCAARVPIAGTTEPEATVEVTGGASVAAVRAAASGAFTVEVALRPGIPQQLRVTARDRDGNVSPAALAEVIHDCTPPQVVAADWALNEPLRISFNEPVVTPGGALRVVTASGEVPGTWSLTGAVASFTPSGSPLVGTFGVTATTAIRDLAGNPLLTAFTRTFGDSTPASFVTGRVLDGATGRPLAGALVVVDSTNGVVHPEPQPSQTTSADGRFRIAVPAGTHCLIFLRQGYTPVLRAVTSLAGRGVDVFDPRLTPVAPLPAVGQARITPLDEQSLPALLPYGWSPAGSVWIDLPSTPAGLPASHTFEVEDPNSAELALVRLELATLQWHVEELLTVAAGQVTAELPEEGGWAVVRADSGPGAPPPSVVGAVLSSSPVPVEPLLGPATVVFQPELVLPHQTSRATIQPTLAPEIPAGVPVTVTIRETLTLLDGNVVAEPPFEADLVLYRNPAGQTRARFALSPSAEARRVPLQLGAEDVVVRRYAGETVRGNVLGPLGGSVASLEGDTIELPPGALVEPVGISLARRTLSEIGLTLPPSLEFLGGMELDLGGRTLAQPATLRLELGTPGSSGQVLIFAVRPAGSGVTLVPIALAIPTATGFSTAPIDHNDLPFLGVRTGGSYVFARSTEVLGFFRGTVTADNLPVPDAPISALPSSSTQLFSWSSSSRLDGRYVFPAPLATITLTAVEPATSDRGTATGTLTTLDERLDLPLLILPTGPFVVETTPANGATDQPAGTEPTVRFSELVDPATVAAGLLLEDAATNQLVPTTLQLQGTTARLIPRASLTPGATYRLRVTSAIRDLTGRLLSPSLTSTFTVREVSLADRIDLTRVHALEPDAAGNARVLGRPGAVPAGSLVFLENTSRLASTPSVTAGADGSFELDIAASLADRILLHVLPPGSNETVAPLPPFLSRDGRTGFVDHRAASFTTLEGFTVSVPAGAFAEPVRITVAAEPAARPAELPLPAEFAVRAGFAITFQSATGAALTPALPLDIRLALPAGSADELLLARRWRPLGVPRWMLYDLLRKDGATWTTAAEAALGSPSSGSASSMAGGRKEPSWSSAVPGEAAPLGLESAPQAASFRDRKRRLPGIFEAGRYLALESSTPLDFFVLPTALFDSLFVQSSLTGMAAGLPPHLSSYLSLGLLIPTLRNQPLSLTGRDLATGFEVFRTEAPAPLPDTLSELTPDPWDHTPPVPVDGNPFRFHTIRFEANGVETLAPGTTAQMLDGSLTVRFADGVLTEGTHVALVALQTGSESRSSRALAAGAVSVSLPASFGRTYLLAVGAPISSTGTVRISFSEALRSSFQAITVRAPNGNDAGARVTPVGSREVVEIAPAAGWLAGGRYVLRFDPGLADAQNNAWGVLLELPFEIEKSQVLGTLDFAEVRDVARVGDVLLVAAGDQGLGVLDVSEPTELPVVGTPAVRLFPLPYGDPVVALAVDPHGRVIVAGGGHQSFGLVRIFDPLTESWVGSTLVSDPLGNDELSTLAPAAPWRVTVLSEDDRDRFRLGQTPPSGVTVATAPQPDGSLLVTASGSATAGLPVTLHNRTRGMWKRVDADAGGAFTVTLSARTGDALELLRNRNSIAYVTLRGLGIGVVNVNSFYREEHGTVPSAASDLLGTYTGLDDPNLQLCGQPVSDIGSALLDLATLVEPGAFTPHRLTLAGLVGLRGLALFESDPSDPGDIRFYNDSCLRFDGSSAVSALEALPDYQFRQAASGPEDTPRDYLLVTHRLEGLLILDVQDRDNVILAGRIPLPVQAVELTVDRERRRAYVSGAGGGLAVVDLDRPLSGVKQDLDGDGKDDRVLEVIELPGSTSAPALVVPELGLAFVGGLDGAGVSAVSVAEPRLEAVVVGESGAFQRITEIGPFGVPLPAGSALSGTFRVLASLPGISAAEIRLEVTSVGPSGQEIDGAGDPAVIPDLPQTSFTGDDGLVLRRLSEDPLHDGHHLYLSEEVAVVADLRAAPAYTRTALEDSKCRRCNAPAEARALLSGDAVEVRLSPALAEQLAPIYGTGRLSRLSVALDSTRWEVSPSLEPEPVQNAGQSSVGPPGVLLHSGELTLSTTDLALPGIGLDFVVSRHYRSGTVGAGPLGPGWELGARRRLRELPTGDVELYDGTGRVETFKKRADGQGYDSPPGTFVDLAKLQRQTTGWLIKETHGASLTFDRFGRLVAVGDPSRRSAGLGNEQRFVYDAKSRLAAIVDDRGRRHRLEYDDAGRLTALEDFQGRRTEYDYDASGQLESVTTPPIPSALVPAPEGLTTSYRYETVVTDSLASRLWSRGQLAAWVDPAGADRITWQRTDADNDGRADEVTSATWGGGTASVAFAFPARTATVTDRVGQTETWELDTAGYPQKHTDAAGGVSTWTYDAEGNVLSAKSPSGITQSFTYPALEATPTVNPSDVPPRVRGNRTTATTTPAPSPGGEPPAPRVLEFQYDPEFQRVSEWKENGQPRASLAIDPQHGRPTAVTAAPGTPVAGTRATEYDRRGRVIRQEDEMGRATRLDYSAAGDLAIVSQLGVESTPTTRFEHDARGNLLAIIDPRGTRTERRWDERDRLIEERVVGTAVKTQYVYDELDRVIEIRRAAGDDGSETTRLRVTYDPGQNQPKTIERELTSGVFAVETRSYDAAERLIQVVGPEGETTSISYLDTDRKVQVTHTGPGLLEPIVETTEYDADGRELAFVDGRGQRWETKYDGFGRPVESKNPLGEATRVTYDDRHRPTRQRSLSPQGCLLAATDTGYDALDRPTQQTAWRFIDPPGLCLDQPTGAEAQTAHFRYDLSGRLERVIDPLDREQEFRQYDSAGRLIRITTPAGATAYSLDAAGLPTAETITEGTSSRTYTHTYDTLGRRTATADPLGQTTHFTYDAQSLPRLTIDPEGTFTETQYDLAGRPIVTLRPEGIRVEQTFDKSDRLIGYRDALGNLTGYSYDALGRRVATVYPDLTQELVTYDPTGNPRTITDPRGYLLTHTYDAVGRLDQKLIERIQVSGQPSGPPLVGPTEEDYDYDGLGRLIRARSGVAGSSAVITEYQYDSLSRRLSETNHGRTFTYGYDKIGARTALSYPSGAAYEIAVDALGRPSSLTQLFSSSSSSSEPRAAFAYQGFRRQATTLGTGLTASHSFDAAARLTAKSWAGGPQALTETLAWTPKNLVASLTQSPVNVDHLAFQYDGAGRLTRRQRSNPPSSPTVTMRGLDSHGFDSAENLLVHTEQSSCAATAETTAFPLDASGRNRPSKVGTAMLEWDSAGNLVRRGDQRYQYDYRNRLTVVTDLTGTEEIARYEYDAFNRRLKKTVGSVVTETVWDGWEPVEEYRDGQLQSRRVFGPELGELVRLEQDLDGNGTLEQTYLPVFDSLGHLAELRREDGSLVERYTYTPFGERRVFLPDTTPPRIEQVLAMPLEIRLEVSEEVDLAKLRDALDTGISLRSQVTGLYFDVTIDQPPTDGCKPGRRLVLRKASTNPEDPWPEPAEPVELYFATDLLTDRAGNTQPATLTKIFSWPTQPVVIQDDVVPRLTTLVVEPAGTVLITFSEPPSLARLASVARINGAAVTWTPLPEGYSVRSPRLAEGSYTLTLSTAELDLADLGLIEPYALSFDVDGERHILKEELPEGQVASSTAGNQIGFHGLGMDEETGLLYARNRYYDPEMGRFVTMDPLGYVDGPNGYQYGMNSPGNYSDRMGLCVLGVRCRDVGSFVHDVQVGIAFDAGSMVLGALDLLTFGTIADTRARADAFLSAQGSLADRAQAAQAVDQGPRLNTVTLGFYGAEDKLDHLKHLVGVAQIQQAGTLLGTAVGLGDWERGLEGSGKLLEGTGALSGTLALGSGAASRAGWIQRAAKSSQAANEARLIALVSDDARLLRGIPFRKRGPVVARALDLETGYISRSKTNVLSVPKDLDPILVGRVRQVGVPPPHSSIPGTHAEVLAIDDLLKARRASGLAVSDRTLASFVTYQEWLTRPFAPALMCPNCRDILAPVRSIPGKR